MPILIINALLVFVYALQKELLDIEVTWDNICLSLIYGGDIVDNGWYLLCIIVFYELFYVSGRFFPKQISKCVFLFTVFYIMLAFYKMPTWWYISSLAFPFGVSFGKYKIKVDEIFRKHFLLCSSCCIIAYLSCFILLFYGQKESEPLLSMSHYQAVAFNLLLSFMHGVLTCFLIVCAMMLKGRNRFCIPSQPMRWLSSIYLEIYVMQGLAFNFLRNSRWYLDNDYLFAVSSIVLTIVLSVIIHPVFLRIIAFVRVPKQSK